MEERDPNLASPFEIKILVCHLKKEKDLVFAALWFDQAQTMDSVQNTG
jgi:hypothetical protein